MTATARPRPGASSRAERLSPWAPLHHRVFAALFAAQLGSNIGSFFQAVAAAWLMGDLTSSPTLVALIQTATLLPVLLIGLPAGALADIVDRRKLLLGTQVWMLTCAATLAALTLLDLVTPAVLLALTFAMGTGGALMGPAWQAIQPDLVPPAEFVQAVALSSMTFNTGRAIGPRSEEHTSELQSHSDLVCRLLLEKKKNQLQVRRFHRNKDTHQLYDQ